MVNFCTNCGKEVDEKVIACTSCGFSPKTENNYCYSCGVKTKENQAMCIKCGVALTSSSSSVSSENQWLVTLLICVFTGMLGIHRFYTGHTAIGVVQLLTLGGCGIWVLIDFILIITGNYKDSNGNYIKSQ
jgi:uncharacterized membrane protein YvbJ